MNERSVQRQQQQCLHVLGFHFGHGPAASASANFKCKSASDKHEKLDA